MKSPTKVSTVKAKDEETSLSEIIEGCGTAARQFAAALLPLAGIDSGHATTTQD